MNQIPLQFFQTIRGPKLTSKLITLSPFPSNAVISPLSPHLSPTPNSSYLSLQTSRNSHHLFTNHLVYMNHSCNPSVVLDIEKDVIRTVTELRKGDEITFFYPSTEWEMSQPFRCWCGSDDCLGEVKGAKFIRKDLLKKWFVNKHIWELKEGLKEE